MTAFENSLPPVSGGGISVQDLACAKSRARTWLGACWVLFFTAALIYSGNDGDWAGLSCLFILPFFLFCCCRYAINKGRRWTTGLLFGLLGGLGLIAMMLLSYRIAYPPDEPAAD